MAEHPCSVGYQFLASQSISRQFHQCNASEIPLPPPSMSLTSLAVDRLKEYDLWMDGDPIGEGSPTDRVSRALALMVKRYLSRRPPCGSGKLCMPVGFDGSELCIKVEQSRELIRVTTTGIIANPKHGKDRCRNLVEFYGTSNIIKNDLYPCSPKHVRSILTSLVYSNNSEIRTHSALIEAVPPPL